MDEQNEREKMQQKCMRLGKYMARVRAEPVPAGCGEAELTAHQTAYLYRRVLQAVQSLTLNGFLTVMLENSFQLLRTPEMADDIGAENIELIHAFLDDFADLWEQEYEWCDGKIAENSPLE